MKISYSKIASVVAAIIGIMSIVAGTQVVLLGKVMDYYVIGWLPVYNLIVGVISLLITAVIIWKGSKFALPAAVATLASHSAIMLVLQTAYRNVVAGESIRAMTVRITLWVIILALLLVQARQNKRLANA